MKRAEAELVELAIALEAMADHYEARPLDGIAWLPGQYAFLRERRTPKLFRAGNQAMGKTWAGLGEVIWRCEGTHPFLRTRPPPIRAWIICASWSQSLEIQEKFWNLADKSKLVAGVRWDPKNGFGDKSPTVRFKNGSIVRFKTTMQGGLQLAGATIDVALFDEPPSSERIFTEVSKRLMRRSGALLMTLTPINAPVDWLRELCERDQVKDLHFRLTPENLIPVGDREPMELEDGTPMDAAWIEAETQRTLAAEVPVVIHGEWETREEGQVFRAFDELKHKHERLPRGEVRVLMGIDHGSKALKQCAVLVYAWKEPGSSYWSIYVLDEDVDEAGARTPDGDAEAFLAMLARHQIAWHELDQVWGDRLYMRRRGLDKKSNKDLQACVERSLRIKSGMLQPPIKTVKRGEGHGAGSLGAGKRFIHHTMIRPGGFGVHPRCKHLLDALRKWDGADDEHKDKIDALRYALDSLIFTSQIRATGPRRRKG